MQTLDAEELVGVIGRVGSGKTTFLQTIIGELYPLERLEPMGKNSGEQQGWAGCVE